MTHIADRYNARMAEGEPVDINDLALDFPEVYNAVIEYTTNGSVGADTFTDILKAGLQGGYVMDLIEEQL